jgi:hypothetical protein
MRKHEEQRFRQTWAHRHMGECRRYSQPPRKMQTPFLRVARLQSRKFEQVEAVICQAKTVLRFGKVRSEQPCRLQRHADPFADDRVRFPRRVANAQNRFVRA